MADQEKSSQTGGAGAAAAGRSNDTDKGRSYPKKGSSQSYGMGTDWNPMKGPMPKEA